MGVLWLDYDNDDDCKRCWERPTYVPPVRSFSRVGYSYKLLVPSSFATPTSVQLGW